MFQEKNKLRSDMVEYDIYSNKNNIYFYGDVCNDSIIKLIKTLHTLNDENHSHINLYLRSMGGELYPAFGVWNHIRNNSTPVWTIIDGTVASSMSVIFMAGIIRRANPYSFMRIHQISYDLVGSVSEIKNEYQNLIKLTKQLESVYLDNSNMDLATLQTYIQNDTILDCNEMRTLGILN